MNKLEIMNDVPWRENGKGKPLAGATPPNPPSDKGGKQTTVADNSSVFRHQISLLPREAMLPIAESVRFPPLSEGGLGGVAPASRLLHSSIPLPATPFIKPGSPALVLAPMEGVTDAPMRAVQGETGAFSYAVTEFLRISQSVPGKAVFLHHVPELRHAATTPTGLPVQVQLLGGHPGRLAEAAVVVCSAGATAIDLNFGCPAPTVNRHDGGASLLKHPARIREIVRAVRDALPSSVPVSAKLRLGWDCVDSIFENAAMAAEGGASWVTIHARTKAQGYAPPVDWPMVGRVRERLAIPVIANGDIWTVEGFRQCREETGCEHFMIGRGALANPLLSRQIAAELGWRPCEPPEVIDWPAQLKRLLVWAEAYHSLSENKTLNRLKQWLRMAAAFGDFSRFEAIKRVGAMPELFAVLRGEAP